MYIDARDFHDHGSFKGPCSDQKHSALLAGMNPHRVGYDRNERSPTFGQLINALEVFFFMIGHALEYMRFRNDNLYCACCKLELVKNMPTTQPVPAPVDVQKEKLATALSEIDARFQFIRDALAKGSITAEQAGIKLRSISIEIGTAGCMPFREEVKPSGGGVRIGGGIEEEI